MRTSRGPWLALVLVLIIGHPAIAGDPADTHPDLHLIPWPKSLQARDGHMRLTAESRIVVGVESLRPLAEVLADEIARLTGLKLKVASGPGQAGDIVLKINPALRAGEPILMMRN